MNGADLLKFQVNDENANTSPGRNPFDVLSQIVEDCSLANNTEEQRIPEDDFKITTDFLNFDKGALVFDLSGKESLGILNLESLNCNLLKDDLSGSNNDQLNSAFLQSHSFGGKRFSYLSSNSSVTPSFFLNSGSLEASELWKSSITSIYKCDYSFLSPDDLNNGFVLSNSTNVLSESKNILNLELDNVEIDKQKRPCKIENLEGNILNSLQEEEETDVEFDDSVFFEARHLAAKIEDGRAEFTSIEDDQLDSTSPPEFVEINEDEQIQDLADLKVEVFSKIDKMIPLVNAPLNPVESENVDAAPLLDKNVLADNTIERKQNTSNTFRNKSDSLSARFSVSNGSSCCSSKDPKEILRNLSEIINNKCKDPQQNWEGQQLIANLADIIFADAQFSETPNEIVENCEPLDLTSKSTWSNDEGAVNLSIKNLMSENAPKELIQSCSISTPLPPSKLLKNFKSKKISSTGSLDCDRDNNGSEFSKLKPKKIDENNSDKKKGPLKAIIPVGNMSKAKDGCLSKQSLNGEVLTPSKVDQLQPNSIRFKRTSTPILNQLKPIAQSTPDNTKILNNSSSSTSQLRRPSYCSPVSPLTKLNSLQMSSANTADVKPSPKGYKRESLSELQNSMYRQHSTTKIKSNNNVLSKFKRTSSTGRNLKISSEINKAKENLSPLKTLIKKATSAKNHILFDQNCISKTVKSMKGVRF